LAGTIPVGVNINGVPVQIAGGLLFGIFGLGLTVTVTVNVAP
jgi:hypothetical protein